MIILYPRRDKIETLVCCLHPWQLIVDPGTFGTENGTLLCYCKWFKSIPFMQHRAQEAQYVVTKYAI